MIGYNEFLKLGLKSIIDSFYETFVHFIAYANSWSIQVELFK